MRFPDLYKYYTQLQPLNSEEWKALEDLCQPISFSKGSRIFTHGDFCKNIIAIRKGIARTFYLKNNGKEYIKIFLTDGQIVSPYIEMITQSPARATAEALTDIQAVSVGFKQLLAVLNSSQTYHNLHLNLVHYFYSVKEQREFEFLTMDANSRYSAFLNDYKNYFNEIPDKHIASYLGITPVSLSRLRNTRSKP